MTFACFLLSKTSKWISNRLFCTLVLSLAEKRSVFMGVSHWRLWVDNSFAYLIQQIYIITCCFWCKHQKYVFLKPLPYLFFWPWTTFFSVNVRKGSRLSSSTSTRILLVEKGLVRPGIQWQMCEEIGNVDYQLAQGACSHLSWDGEKKTP